MEREGFKVFSYLIRTVWHGPREPFPSGTPGSSLPLCICLPWYIRESILPFTGCHSLNTSLVALGADTYYQLRAWLWDIMEKETGDFPLPKKGRGGGECNLECEKITKELSTFSSFYHLFVSEKLPTKSHLCFLWNVHINIESKKLKYYLKSNMSTVKLYIQLRLSTVTNHEGNSKPCLRGGRVFLEFTCSSHTREKRKRQVNILLHLRDVPGNMVNWECFKK